LLKQNLPQSKNKTGAIGESIAVAYLIHHKFQILERNFKIRYGEIDIVALDKSTLVFVEVKTRRNDVYGSPESSVNSYKLREVIRTGYLYAARHPEYPKSLRVDVIAILLHPTDNSLISLRYIKNVTGG